MSFLKNIFSKKIKVGKKIILYPLLVILLLLLAVFFYNIYFWGTIFPNISLAGFSVSGKYPQVAADELGQKIAVPEKIVLAAKDQSFEIPTRDIELAYDFVKSASYAYEFTRTGNIFYDLSKRIELIFRPSDLGLRLTFNEQKLQEALSVIAGQITTEPVFPSVKITKGEVLVDKGAPGSELDIKLVSAEIGKALAHASGGPVVLPLKTIDPTLSDQEADAYRERAEKLKDKTLTLKFEFQVFNFKGNELLALLDPKSEYAKDAIDKAVESVSGQVNREPQDSVFVFEAGRVQEFAPAKDGVVVKSDSLADMIRGNLRTLETSEETKLSLDIPVERKAPKIQNEDVNNLGIKELIGRGSSRFSGSIANRIHNVALAASRFKGVLVEPGATFSFNDVLGDVSDFTGYKQAYIIKDGKTVLGDGGGVCQVSTTLFRAVLNAGLPIIERRAHAYRVGYYEQDSPPGLDATVYAPTTDFKFKNDTSGHILIQTITDTKKLTLVFEIYGTSDGRIATTSKPVVSGVTPPPEDLYVDDPTLPLGKINQIEHKAWGAKVTFNYKVERDGELIYQKTFLSNYRPWQAVYLRGTGPAQ